MKISDYSPHKPIILGDLGQEAKALPKVTAEEILAMQPASTRKLLSMSDEEHDEYSEREIVDWKAPEIKIEEKLDDAGNLLGLQVGEKFVSKNEIEKYYQDRREREHKHYYKADKTALIHPANATGDYEGSTPEWKKNIAKKTAEPDHPRLAAFKQPKENWVEASWGQAFVAWLQGKKVRRIDE